MALASIAPIKKFLTELGFALGKSLEVGKKAGCRSLRLH